MEQDLIMVVFDYGTEGLSYELYADMENATRAIVNNNYFKDVFKVKRMRLTLEEV